MHRFSLLIRENNQDIGKPVHYRQYMVAFSMVSLIGLQNFKTRLFPPSVVSNTLPASATYLFAMGMPHLRTCSFGSKFKAPCAVSLQRPDLLRVRVIGLDDAVSP